ncbi:dienelactone hydrolase family protein [Ramlibacter sp.]|uniref:dienelactone hydrolase family protein n=1 Tax=Ramlibacter sp. TaxID=1917967 RepID=UPI002C627A40|nr:dienelactone hydrolase family protein [Ramlibacter sp.]HWI80920.1 dienelactone hydrolase family protein [Ramlibacter sp.]
MRWRLAAALTGLLAGAAGAGAPAPQQVRFDSLDGTPLTASVFLPAGATRGAVVALHGCGGLYARHGERAGSLNARHQAMADLLLGQGYAVVFPDSLTPRGENELCTQRIASRRIGQFARRADALAALDWVAAQPWADPQRIALLGWSHGGSAVLAATDRARPPVRHHAVRPAVAIAFYPGCRTALYDGYQPSAPLVLMLAEHDDWTAPEPCIELGRVAAAEVHVFRDSFHDFDNPKGSVRLRRDVPNGVHPGRGVHAGPNPTARDQAYARVVEALARAFR